MESSVPVKTDKTVFDVVEGLVELQEAKLEDVADYLDMPVSTTFDHLRSLESLGYVVKNANGYTISTRFLSIAGRHRRNSPLYNAARPEVQHIAAETGELTALLIEENGVCVAICVSKPESAVNIGSFEGRRVKLSASAPGRAILANLPDDRITNILDEHGLPQYTDSTITDRDELFDQLETIRKQGYATSQEGYIEGIQTIAAPILRQDDVLGAISISTALDNMQGEWFDEELPSLLMRRANAISLSLTHSRWGDSHE